MVVHSRTASKAERPSAEGAVAAKTTVEFAELAVGGIVIICLPDTPKTQADVDTMADFGLTGTLVIDMGTCAHEATLGFARTIETLEGRFIDAPVSGGVPGAESGTLFIMAGGTAVDIARAKPGSEVLGKAHTHISPTGLGLIANAANQAVVGATITIVSEAMVMAEAGGADPAKLREALLGGFAPSRIMELHGQKRSTDLSSRGRLFLQHKDLAQTNELAESLDLELPVLRHCQYMWPSMIQVGMGNGRAGELDNLAFYTYTQYCQQCAKRSTRR